MKRLLFVVTTIVAAVAAMTTGAAASISTTVDFVARAFGSNGQVTVPAGSILPIAATMPTRDGIGSAKRGDPVAVPASVPRQNRIICARHSRSRDLSADRPYSAICADCNYLITDCSLQSVIVTC